MTFRSLTLACLVLILAVQVQAEEKPSRPVTPYGTLYKKWEAEKGDMKRGSEDLKKLNQAYTHDFFELAQKHSKNSDLWLDCLIWIGVNGQPGEDLDGMIELVQKLAKKVSNTTQLQLFMSELIDVQSDKLNPALEEIAKTHPDKGVRGGALYALAARTKIEAERQSSLEGCESAKVLLKKVIEKYPEVSTYQGTNFENAEPLLKHLEGPCAIGKVSPESTGTTLDGGEFQLSTLKGKVVVLVFSASWCGPCNRMHPIEKALIEKLPKEQFAFVEINVDKPSGLVKVREKRQKDGLEWEVVIDGSDGPLAELWNVTAYPTFYILDQQQRIRYRATGFLGEKLEECVETLVKEAGSIKD